MLYAAYYLLDTIKHISYNLDSRSLSFSLSLYIYIYMYMYTEHTCYSMLYYIARPVAEPVAEVHDGPGHGHEPGSFGLVLAMLCQRFMTINIYYGLL